MRDSLGTFPLKNLQTEKYENAELFSMIAKNNVDDFESKWKPLMEARKNSLKPDETLESANIQDSHWKWGRKAQAYSNRLDYESFAIECDDITQGLMLVNNIATARELSQFGKFIIYIDLVAVAPWNRIGFSKKPLYKGIGPLLLAAAISYSIDQEFEGRIGLHSLPQSESWYIDHCKMTDLGPDKNYPNELRYFEMTPEQAQIYINN